MTGHHAPTTSPSLLVRLAANDEDAWRTFLSRYRPLIDAWCARRLGPSDAEEVASAIWCKLVRQMRVFAYDRRKGRFRSWLCKLVQNEITTYLQRIDRLDTLPANCPDPASLADELSDRIDHDLSLAEVVADRVRGRVEPHTWRVFWLVAVEGRGSADVARELGLTLQALCQARRRIALMLKAELERAFPEGQP